MALKQDDDVMFLDVQSKYNLLSRWGCKRTCSLKNVHWVFFNNCESGSLIRDFAFVIAEGRLTFRVSVG
jgi:hypothetical protein